MRGYYWPLQRDDRLEDWVNALELHNYQITDDRNLEAGVEKVAIYVNDLGSPEHVARQLPSGEWTSKIGRYEDITHETLSALEGQEYGSPRVIMKRSRFVRP